MAGTGYRLQIGELDCTVVSDGYLSLPGDRKMDVNLLFIRTGNHKIMIDTGCGVSPQKSAGKLVQNLESEGVKASDIDLIIHTHGHSDHVGGNTDEKGKPVFANARHVIHKLEWDYWIGRLEQKPAPEGMQKMMLEVARKNLLPLKDRFDLVDKEMEIVPGIKFSLAPGHTPGNIILMLSSGPKQLLCIGDLAHDPDEFVHPEMYRMIDSLPDQAHSSRIEVLSKAAESRIPVFAAHFAYPGLGRMVKKGDVLQWRAVKSGDKE
jgi:glyoxylase-like metal-dependent hydrolase (beta-lactamase superfamily II)